MKAAAVLALVSHLAAGMLGAQATSTAGRKPAGLTVGKVIEMLQLKVPEPLVIAQIKASGRQFPLTADDLIGLKRAGAGDAVLVALQGGAAEPQAPPAPVPAAAPPPVATQAPPVERTPARQRLAVMDFDYSAVETHVQAVFGTHVNLGRGINVLLVKRLAEAKRFSIVERNKVEVLMKEQDFNGSSRVKRGTGARAGQILGADLILTGDITVFGRDDVDKRMNVGGWVSRLPGVGHFPGVADLKWGRREEKAVVVIDYRLIDAESSEVVDSGEARGESQRESRSWEGLLGLSRAGVHGGVDMTSSNFAETIIGEATIDCVNKLAGGLNRAAGTVPEKRIDVEARVADVSGSWLTISAGTAQAVRVGDKFSVERILKELKDPVTKEVLDLQTQTIGELTITVVRERVATGAFRGTAAPQVGDAVRKL